VSQAPPHDPFVPPPPPQVGNPMYPPEMLAEKARVAASDAKTALTFSIIGIFCFGFIFGFLAFRKANQVIEIIDTYEVAQEKRGLATAAKIIGIIDIALWAVGLVLRVALS
jgi:hypothetical protein